MVCSTEHVALPVSTARLTFSHQHDERNYRKAGIEVHGKNTNLFLQLRRILQQFDKHPIFSVLFETACRRKTAGRFKQFFGSRCDPSARTRESNNRPLSKLIFGDRISGSDHRNQFRRPRLPSFEGYHLIDESDRD